MNSPRQTPLLDMWEAPEDAGEPVGVLASTFDIEPDFFERNCLARFLAVESVSEGGKSVDDIVAQVELEEKLAAPIVTILADRSAQAERSSLRWNLLHCAVINGLLHAKVALLLWENATRVIVSSANLTPTGYRTNLELAVAADLGGECILPGQVLTEIADELEAYLDLVPGLNAEVPARIHATSMIELFRVRLAEQPSRLSGVRVTMAPTTPDAGPLERLPEVWRGGLPLEATHLSPYWDNDDRRALDAVSALLTGRPTSSRRHDVGVTVGMTGKIAFPQAFSSEVNSVCLLESADDKTPRSLHAKCLVLRSNDWVAALIGSSNHTTAGLGLGPSHSRRHRELNLWIGASIDSDAGTVLASLITLGKPLPPGIGFEDPTDDDDSEDIIALPTFFTLSRITKVDDTWQLSMGFEGESPGRWRIALPNGEIIADSEMWSAEGMPHSLIRTINAEGFPSYLTVNWSDKEASWVVIVDDRLALPPGPQLKDLRASQLLDALANGKSIAQAVREQLERTAHAQASGGIVVDPLKRFDSSSTLLRRGRALGRALSNLERRLADPVVTIATLRSRLQSPIGPTYLATRMIEDYEAKAVQRSEAVFTLAEVALSVGRVDWTTTLQHVDTTVGLATVRETIDSLSALQKRLHTDDSHDVTEYADRALREANACLNN